MLTIIIFYYGDNIYKILTITSHRLYISISIVIHDQTHKHTKKYSKLKNGVVGVVNDKGIKEVKPFEKFNP